MMPRVIEIGVTVDELAARRLRIERTKRFELPDRVPAIPAIAHEDFKKMTRTQGNISFVRTGEVTKYANTMLVAGVVF